MYDLYSRRIKEANGEPEVFIYDKFQKGFRNQFFTIITNFFYKMRQYWPQENSIIEILCEEFAQEKGLKYIPGGMYNGIFILENSLQALEKYIDTCSDEDFLDLMDFIFGSFIGNKEEQEDIYNLMENDIFQDAIDELNLRLKQNSLGYEFINGEIIKKTNTFTHENIVKPALKLLSDEEFRGAEEEYLQAYEHFKNSNNKEAIHSATKAFESTMKIICAGMNYNFDKDKDTAKKLIDILEKNSFYPSYLNNFMSGLRTTSKGAPTVRNKDSGHGQGETIKNVTDEYVEYVLNLVATDIVFLYKIYKEKKVGHQ